MFEIQRPKPQIKEAFWIGKRVDKYHYTYVCSNCKSKSKFRKSPYCPICGYRMLEGEK